MTDNLIGMRFGRLVVLDVVKDYNPKVKRNYWYCKCDCGGEKIVLGYSLKCGGTKSCGCLRKENTSKMFSTHKMTDTRLHYIWTNMLGRCNNPKNKGYPYYGGRGISVCEEWRSSFVNFYKWSMSSGYSDDLTIDRIDVNGNYCPENCRWADKFMQMNNMTSNRYVTYRNETHTCSEWDRILGFRIGTMKQRMERGWEAERAITTPTTKCR